MLHNVISGGAFGGFALLAHAILADAFATTRIAPYIADTTPARATPAADIFFAGWPVELCGAAWFLLVLTIQRLGARESTEVRRRVTAYLLATVVPAFSVVLLIAGQVRANGQLPRAQLCLAAVCVVVVAVAAALSRQASLRAVVHGIIPDLRLWGTQSSTWFGVALFLALMVAGGPLSQTAPNGVPTGREFGAWWKMQPRLQIPNSTRDSAVQIVKFNDYECPPCKRSQQQHGAVLSRLAQTNPGMVHLVVLDFPLDAECNPYVQTTIHPAACEAAVAVRLAREHGRDAKLEEWLWENQATLSAESIWDAARNIAGVKAIPGRYEAVLADVQADIEIGHALGVAGTPTYFINGRRLPFVHSRDFQTALLLELASAEAGARRGAEGGS